MTTHVISLFLRPIILRSAINGRNFSFRSQPLSAKKPGFDDEKPDNVFNIFKSNDPPKGGLTKERVDELSKLSQNAFKLFGLNEEFNINTRRLQREMQKLQQLLHPDRIYDADKSIRDKAYHLSTLVNDFYDTLHHPYKRAKYLLSVAMKKSQDEIEKDLEKLEIDSEFLTRMMDLRETLENPMTREDILVRIELELSADLRSLTKELSKDFENKNTDIILTKLGKLKFLANCHHIVTDRLGSFSGF